MSNSFMSGYKAGIKEGIDRMITRIKKQYFPVSGARPNLYGVAAIHEESINSIRHEVLDEFRLSEKVVTDEYIISHWSYVNDEAKPKYIAGVKARMMSKLIDEYPDAQFNSISFEVGPLDERTKEVYFQKYMTKMGTACCSSVEEVKEHIDKDYMRVVMHATIHEEKKDETESR